MHSIEIYQASRVVAPRTPRQDSAIRVHSPILAQSNVAATVSEDLPMRKIVVIARESGNGKTTLGRQLADRLSVPFIELDELVHGPGWVETPDEELRDQLVPLISGDGWVADGAYHGKLGDLVLDEADTVVWWISR